MTLVFPGKPPLVIMTLTRISSGCFGLLLLAATTVLHTQIAVADTDLFNSLAGSSIGNNPVDSGTGSGPLYASFSTTSQFNLTGIDLVLSSLYNSPGSFSVGIYSDSSTNPGTLLQNLGTFDDSSLNITPSVFTVGLPTPYTLDSNSRYWVGLSSANSSSAWSITTDTTGVGVAAESYANSALGVQANSTGPHQMRVFGTAVPEPSTWSLIAVGTLALGFAARRQSRG